MTPSSTTAKGPRQTRSARREETRIALLNATIQSLITHGYAATTTRGVAEIAGVSQGAQQHHYPTKSELVKAATIHLAEVFVEALRADPPAADTERDRAALLVDVLWMAANQPLTAALLEFVAAARTDPEIADTVVDLIAQIDTLAFATVTDIAPNLAATPGARDWLRITVSSMCGAVAVTALPGGAAFAPAWPNLRDNILAGLDRLISADR
ncbi:TetR/AcrR family transcriptional regulator [Nocardia vinacea]|uniref:TetR/AcrR family transcriptional regulator n=1 Tax=Nocardia vinacea TaxID=96468 RepID=UPI00343FAF16